MTTSLSLREIARALGGEVCGRKVLCPGPNHSGRSISGEVWAEAEARGLGNQYRKADIRCPFGSPRPKAVVTSEQKGVQGYRQAQLDRKRPILPFGLQILRSSERD